MSHGFDSDYWATHWREISGRGDVLQLPPNPYLISEVGGLVPGTALDAGCGAGAEAAWLAEQGWQVTAVDISDDVLARAARQPRPVQPIRWVRADLSVWAPEGRFDLVTTHYAHSVLSQLEFYRRLSSWVAPGGTLFIVGHLDRPNHDHDRGHDHREGHGSGRCAGQGHGHDGQGHGRDGEGPAGGPEPGSQDPDRNAPGTGTPGTVEPPAEATVTAARTANVLDPERWEIVTADERVRTVAGGGGAPRELHDVVVRAVRRP